MFLLLIKGQFGEKSEKRLQFYSFLRYRSYGSKKQFPTTY